MKLLLLLTMACAGGAPTPQETLERTAFSYNEHLRWKRFDKASRFVTDKDRPDFMKTFEPTEDTLNIDDIEVKSIDMDGEKKATITINVRFYKLPSVTLKKEKWVQVWQKKEDDWWLIENVKGPFFKDEKK